MYHFDEYFNRYGFNDGNETPPDAVAIRTIYITVLNVLAEKKGSTVRVVAFDCETHNPCRIGYMPLEKLEAWGWKDYTEDAGVKPDSTIHDDEDYFKDFEADTAMQEAVEELEMDEDESFYEYFYNAYTVNVKVVKKGLNDWVKYLKKK